MLVPCSMEKINAKLILYVRGQLKKQSLPFIDYIFFLMLTELDYRNS